MRLVTYRDAGNARVGVLVAGGVCDVCSISGVGSTGRAATMIDLLADAHAMSLVAEAQPLAQAAYNLSAVELLPPVLQPTKVIGVGMNYRPFLAQIGGEVPAGLALFHKTSSALTGHGAAIVIPDAATEAVPEGELAVIIGKSAQRVGVGDALNHVAGYTCANDVSARNLEFVTSQWTAGKMMPTFCPLGPAIVTPDEIGGPDEVEIITTVNGVKVQHGSTSEMVFGVADLISRLSHLVILESGDVVLTGTPSDLGEQRPPSFLRPGDTVSVSVSGVGVLTNPVEAASDRNHQ